MSRYPAVIDSRVLLECAANHHPSTDKNKIFDHILSFEGRGKWHGNEHFVRKEQNRGQSARHLEKEQKQSRADIESEKEAQADCRFPHGQNEQSDRRGDNAERQLVNSANRKILGGAEVREEL